MNYRESPAYQRLVQRMDKIRPENRHLLNNMLSPDAKFAGREYRRGLQAKGQKSRVDYRNKSLGLRREVFEDDQRSSNIASLIGVGNVAASTHFGMKRDAIDMELLKKKLAFAKKFGV